MYGIAKLTRRLSPVATNRFMQFPDFGLLRLESPENGRRKTSLTRGLIALLLLFSLLVLPSTTSGQTSSFVTTIPLVPQPACSPAGSLAVNPATNTTYVGCRGVVKAIVGTTVTATYARDGSSSGFLAEVAVNPSTNRVYIAQPEDSSVKVIDGSTNLTITKINLPGSYPWAIAVNPVTNRIYVSNLGASGAAVYVIDGVSNAVIATPPVDSRPISIGIDTINNRIYVANETAHTVSVIDGATSAVVASIPVGQYPRWVAVNPATRRIYVSSLSTVSVIDGLNNTVIATLGYPTVFGTGPLAVDATRNYIYLIGYNTQYVVQKISGATNTVLSFTALGQSQYTPTIAYNSSANTAATVTSFGWLLFIEQTSLSVNTLSTGASPQELGINPVTNTIYVADYASDSVFVVNGATNTIVNQIPVGPGPKKIGINHLTNRVYTSHSLDSYGYVRVIDSVISSVVATISVGPCPGSIEANAATNSIYVSDDCNQSLQVINGATNSIIATVPGVSGSLAVDTVNNKVYVAAGVNGLIVVDGTTNTVQATTPIARAASVEINGVTNRIYVGQYSVPGIAASIAVLDGTSRNLITTVALPNFIDPNANPRLSVNRTTNMIYASTANSGNTENSSVDVINGNSNELYAVVTVAAGPSEIAVNESTGRVYTNSSTSGVLSSFGSVSCAVGINPTSRVIGGDMQTGSLQVSTSEACYWAVTAQASWITMTSAASGTGPGSVQYSVGANSTGASRSGTITVGGQVFTLTQNAVPPPSAPTSPYPSYGATSVNPGVVLRWTGDSAATSYDVYFGTADSPAFLANTIYPYYQFPSLLNSNTTYYWRVIAKNGAGSTSSATWWFTTTVPTVITAVSVSPSSGSGAGPQVFTAVVSDSIGASDLWAVTLDFGSVADATHDCKVGYVQEASVLWLYDDANSGILGPIGLGSGGSLSNSQCTVFGGSTRATGGPGNTLRIPFTIQFQPGYGGLKNIFLSAISLGGVMSNNGAFTTMGTWTPSPSTPGVVSVTPNAGTGTGPQVFTAVYSDTGGANDLQAVYLDFGSVGFAAHNCIAVYVPGPNTLYLFNDDNSGAVGPIAEGAGGGSISNSQCTLTSGTTRATLSGNNLAVPFNITFKNGYGGRKTIFGLAQTYSGVQSTGGVLTSLGTWQPSSTIPAVVSVTPNGGNGPGPATFMAAYSDTGGANDLQVVYLSFGSSFLSTHGCNVGYMPGNNQLILFGDDNTIYATVGENGPGSVSNSQCTLSGGSTAATMSGTSVTVPFAITFKAGFSGAKNIYGLAQTYDGTQSAITTLGSWTP